MFRAHTKQSVHPYIRCRDYISMSIAFNYIFITGCIMKVCLFFFLHRSGSLLFMGNQDRQRERPHRRSLHLLPSRPVLPETGPAGRAHKPCLAVEEVGYTRQTKTVRFKPIGYKGFVKYNRALLDHVLVVIFILEFL